MNRRITMPNNRNSRCDVWMFVGLHRRQRRQYRADRITACCNQSVNTPSALGKWPV